MKKFIIILSASTLTVALAAIMITASLVSKNRPPAPSANSDIPSGEVKSPDKTVEQSKPTVNVTDGVSLTRLYDENSITLSEHTEMHHGISCTFNQLSGLKDTAIQEKLNKTIADTQIALLEEYSKEFTPSDSSSTIYVGFSNLISVEYSFWSTKAFDTRQVYYTYNLADGLLVNLKDIFIDSADYIPIINSAFYDAFLLSYEYIYDGREGYVHYDESGVLHVNESKLFKVLKEYISQPQSQFGFDDTNIYFSCGEIVASAEMRYIADKLAIFDRFVTEESLFKDESVGRKNLIVCCEYPKYDQSKIETGYLEDNLWYDIIVTDFHTQYVSEEQNGTLESLKTNLYTDQKSVLEDYSKTAKKNPDKTYIILQKGILNYSMYGLYFDGIALPDTIQMFEGTIILEMPRDYFENVYKAKLYDKYRDGYQGFWSNTNGRVGIDMQNPNIKEIKYTETLYLSAVDLITGKVQGKRQVDLEKEEIRMGGVY